jgi:peptidoglycan/LPS O-acetylase OafA/YrhL
VTESAQRIDQDPTRSWNRLDGVDCLRALAIFYVLMNHVNMQLLFGHVPYTKGLPPRLVNALVWQGQNGVQIFFAVSGFLITSTSIRRWGSVAQIRMRDFYLIRFARIAPLFLTLLMVLSALHLLGVKHFVISEKAGGLGSALFAALTFHTGWLEATRDYLPGSWDIMWSLGVEEVFYLAFPLACRFLSRGKFLLLLAALVILGPFARTIFTQHNPVWREYSYLGGMDAIAMGCVTATLLSRWRPSRSAVALLAIGGVAIMIFCLTGELQMAVPGVHKTGLAMSILAAAACMLIVAAAETRWQAARMFAPLLAYGRRSYEVYLTHMFVVFAAFDVFVKFGKPVRLVPLLFVCVIGVAGVLGEIVGRLFSEPANRWLRNRFRDGPAKLGSVVQQS